MTSQGARPKSVPPPLPVQTPVPPKTDAVIHEDDVIEPAQQAVARVVPPPLPIQISEQQDDFGEPRRDSVVPEDDIIGGRIHVMYDRLAHDDYQGALMVAETLLAREPDHHDATQCRAMCRTALSKVYLSRLGSLDRVPQLSVEPEQAGQRVTDPGVEAILPHVNGLQPLGAIVRACELAELEALRLLSELFLREVIEFEDE